MRKDLEERLEEEGDKEVLITEGISRFQRAERKKNPIWQSRTIKRGCLLKRGLLLL